MYAENLGGDDGSNGKAIEDVYEGLPGLDVTATFAFIIKTVD